MEIVNRKTDELTPYEKNPRINDNAVKYVAESIKQFGFKVPIVIDENDVIVAGHTRLKAAEVLGLDDVPCVVADDLTEEQVRAFRLADNKVAEAARWNVPLLMSEIRDLNDVFDLTKFGFKNVAKDVNIYSDKLEGLFYSPRGTRPDVADMYDTSRRDELLNAINACGIDFSEAEIDFINAAAARFIEFNYEKIADYYCFLTDEKKKAFEALSLVIVDYGKRIARAAEHLVDEIERLRSEEETEAEG